MAVTAVAVAATGLLAEGQDQAAPPARTQVVAEPSPAPTTPSRPSAPSPTPTPTPTSTPPQTPTQTPPEDPVAVAAPMRVQVPSVGLDVPVLPDTPSGGELDPPTLGKAYWIEPYGTPGTGADNTVYLAGHSYDSGDAAFNPLFDRARQVARVAAGDEVVLTTAEGRLTYVVDGVERYPKDELADTDEVWRVVPGRLVLITCFQRNDGRASQDNLVVYASLVAGEPA